MIITHTHMYNSSKDTIAQKIITCAHFIQKNTRVNNKRTATNV